MASFSMESTPVRNDGGPGQDYIVACICPVCGTLFRIRCQWWSYLKFMTGLAPVTIQREGRMAKGVYWTCAEHTLNDVWKLSHPHSDPPTRKPTRRRLYGR